MDTAKEYPVIEIEYVTVEDPLESIPYLYSAAEIYTQSRQPEEEAYVRIESSGSKVSVKLGRNVLESISYAEIVEKAEKMHRDIDASAVLRENDVSAATIFAGYRLSGNLPGQE